MNYSWLFDTSKPGVSFVKIYVWLLSCWIIIISGFVLL